MAASGGHREVKGLKRQLIRHTLGLVPAVLTTAANVHDTTGGKLLLNDLAAAHPSVSKVRDDGADQRHRMPSATA